MPVVAPAPPLDYPGCIRVLANLADLVEAKQRRLSLTAKVTAAQIGIVQTTLAGLYAGNNPQHSTVLLCLRWLAKP